MKHASDEFVQKVRVMSDDALLAAYRETHARFDILEAERWDSWKRMMTAIEKQEDMADEMSVLNTAVHLIRELTVPR